MKLRTQLYVFLRGVRLLMAAIDWAHIYKPRVVLGSINFDMPLPIMTAQQRFSQDMKQTKVPLQDGVILSGVSRGSLTVSMNGIISKNTLSGMLDMKDALVDLFINSSGTPYTFYFYHDDAKQNYRWFENCVTNDLTFSPVHNQIYTLEYSLQIVVPSGIEKTLVTTTGEAASSIGDNKSGIIRDGVSLTDPAVDFVANLDTLPDDRTLLFGPLLVKLPDTDGTSSFLIQDGDGNFIFKVDSSGKVQTLKPVSLVRSISISA